jgi:uncharacterized protein YcaQ
VAPVRLTQLAARRLWISAQRLDRAEPFGRGPAATAACVKHLGYVQIDTIHVIERSHHHILFSRIPRYQRSDLAAVQSVEKSVFEYWTHALAYVALVDYRFFVRYMRSHQGSPHVWYTGVTDQQIRRMLARIERDGPLTMRDIDDDVLVDKDHAWASRKPSKRVLQLAFYRGYLTISQRVGMLKTYELTKRHFGWTRPPRAATSAECDDYVLERALRSQGLVSLDSVCHLEPSRKPAVAKLIERRIAKKTLVRVDVLGAERVQHWAAPELLEQKPLREPSVTHLLSPFDPLVIQRKRLALFFDYQHRFEAYVPREKRIYGYFALPVLVGDRIRAVIDLKTDRAAKKLLIQNWTWLPGTKSAETKRRIEAALDGFERFQLGH